MDGEIELYLHEINGSHIIAMCEMKVVSSIDNMELNTKQSIFPKSPVAFDRHISY